jgi:AraC-like DNA-binding protein
MKQSDRKHFITIDQRLMLKIAVTGFFILWIVNLNFFIVLDVMHRTELCPYTTSLYFYSIFILFNIFLFLLLVKPPLLSKKYIESRLGNDHKNQLFERLLQYMQTQRPYFNPEISLSELSNNLTIPGRILSQIINEKAGQNFFDFINRYRVEECKRLLKEKTRNEKNISEIFYSVGFNSKSTFNTSFKKFTGYTPSEYRAFFS